MGDVIVFEAAKHMNNRIDLADIGEKLVAEAFTTRCPAHQPGDIDEFELVGRIFCDLPIRARLSRRGSGTATRPTLGSMVQNG